MQSITLLIGLLAFVFPVCFAADALVTTDNPQGAAYIAALPKDGATTGSVVASSVANGTGVHFNVNFAGLPTVGGPFSKLITCPTSA